MEQIWRVSLYNSCDGETYLYAITTNNGMKTLEDAIKIYNEAREEWYSQNSDDFLIDHISERLEGNGYLFSKIEEPIPDAKLNL